MSKKERIFTIVCGMSGYGKTYFLQNYLVPELLKKGKPVFILDIMNEYQGRKMDGFRGLVKHLRETGAAYNETYVIAWKNSADAVNVIHLIRAMEKPVSLVVEESHVLFSDQTIKKAVQQPLQELTLFGRHFGVDMILSTQRPNLLSTTLRSQAQFFISFRQEERADIDYLSVRNAGAAEKIANLKKREFVSFGDIPTDFNKLKNNQVTTL